MEGFMKKFAIVYGVAFLIVGGIILQCWVGYQFIKGWIFLVMFGELCLIGLAIGVAATWQDQEDIKWRQEVEGGTKAKIQSEIDLRKRERNTAMAEAERVRCQVPYLRRSFQHDDIRLITVDNKPIYAYILSGDQTMYLVGFWPNMDPDLIWNLVKTRLREHSARLVDFSGQSQIRRVRLEEKQKKCKKCRFALNGKPGKLVDVCMGCERYYCDDGLGLGDKFKPVEEEKEVELELDFNPTRYP